jgi:tetratricopeptide (TPR) repeat protein
VTAGAAASYHNLGNVAYRQSDYDQAVHYYRRALAIDEELGNRNGVAVSHHQLGVIAQARGDYTEAENHYERALEIHQELGNQEGAANTLSQIGTLLTETGRPREAITYTVQSLVRRLELRSPDAQIDLRWLARQRELMSDIDFTEAISQSSDVKLASLLIQVLDQTQAR